jgi:hypothetical protein
MNALCFRWASCGVSAVCIALAAGSLLAADKAEGKKFEIAEGKFSLKAPAAWVAKKPKTSIVETEFEVPAAEGDDAPGRVTVMGAGGSIEANIERWKAQFSQPEGVEEKDAAKVEKKKIAGQQVHLVDISGDYVDRGPFQAQGVERENYRMLAAIVETSQNGKRTGNYFIKFVGPAKTVAENAKGFQQMIESLSAN